MSILIKRLPEKKWEDITREDVNNAIDFDYSKETRDRFNEDDVKSGDLGCYWIKYIPGTYNDFDADKDSITTLFAGNYATAVYLPGLVEPYTLDALRMIAWDFVSGTSGRGYACDNNGLEEALDRISFTHSEWIERVGNLLMNMILGL